MCTNNWHNSSLFLRVWASSTISTVKVCIPISLLVGLWSHGVASSCVLFDTVGAHPGSRHRHHHYCYHVAGPWGRPMSSSPVSSTLQAWCHSHQCHQGLNQGEGVTHCGGKCLPWEGERSLCRGFFLPDFCANYAILLFPIVKCPSFYGETLISGIMKSLKS